MHRERRRPRTLRRAVLLAIIGTAAMLSTHCLRQDEVECEEAVATLLECCAGFERYTVQCQFNDVCGISYPDLAPAESECIFGKPCSEIRSRKICERVTARGELKRRQDSGGTDAQGTPPPAVCE